MTTCNRCGQCCYLQDKDGKYTSKKCRHLVYLKSGKTICRIYKTRLGKRLDEFNVCGPREVIKHNFKGCPYNKQEVK
jgi:hypothetical protein